MIRRVLVLAACALLAAACTSDVDLGQVPSPPPPPPPPREECGNGLDDDGNGLVDDGCVCATSEARSCWPGSLATDGVGQCARGVMRCEVDPGLEWGRWGACEGARLPSEERCGGGDEDCDGAVDEGCPPCEVGAERPCEGPSRAPPCEPGVQRCVAAGVWSGCEGAVLPSPEVCDNGIDDDCDGEIDDARLCGCVSEPERCGNGRDDDCDGLVDLDDVCVSCPATVELCDGEHDDDCDGRIDEGCAPDGGVDGSIS